MLDPSTAVELSLLPGALGARILRERLDCARLPTFDAATAPSVDAVVRRAVPAPRADAILTHVRRSAAALVAALAAGRRHAVFYGGAGFPDLLAQIADPPPCLWLAGPADVLSRPAVAVVGSRAATPSSCEVAFGLAHDLG
jgi:DNA processing protein